MRRTSRIGLVFFTIFISSAAWAAIPQTLHYSGKLDTGEGVFTGTIDVRFRLYENPVDDIGGIWDEEQAVAVNGGRFQVQLGANNPLPSLNQLGSALALHLTITVKNEQGLFDSYDETAKMPILSVPYALLATQATNAATVGGQAASDFAAATHSHALADLEHPDCSAGQVLTSNGSGWVCATESDPHVGANTAHQVPKWDGSALVAGSITDIGNVGIGKTDPTHSLDVGGTARFAGALTAESTVSIPQLGLGTGTYSSTTNPYEYTRFVSSEAPNGVGGIMHSRTGDYGTDSLTLYTQTSRDLILKSPRVGVNNPNPTAALDVSGGIVASGSLEDSLMQGVSQGGGDTQMNWYPERGAFRAGGLPVDLTASIGGYSVAMGQENVASGWASTALGAKNTASESSAMAMGLYTTASGWVSTALGYYTAADGWFSTAMGGYTTASGNYSTALGSSTIASGARSTAMGGGTTASGDWSTAMGFVTTASGDYSTAMGHTITVAAGADRSIGIGLADSGQDSSLFPTISQPDTLAIMGGNVGIGTVSPSVALEVDGTVRADGLIHGDGGRGTVTRNVAQWHSNTQSGNYIFLRMPAAYDKQNGQNRMFHVRVRGYSFSTTEIVDLTFVGYNTSVANGGPLSHTAILDHAGTCDSLLMYHSGQDDHLYLRFRTGNTYYLSFSVDSMYVGNGIVMQPGDITVHSASGNL